MTTIQTKIPDAILRQAKNVAERENLSLEEVISLCIAYSLGVLNADGRIAERAKEGSRAKFLEFMSKVPSTEPEDYDRLD